MIYLAAPTTMRCEGLWKNPNKKVYCCVENLTHIEDDDEISEYDIGNDDIIIIQKHWSNKYYCSL